MCVYVYIYIYKLLLFINRKTMYKCTVFRVTYMSVIYIIYIYIYYIYIYIYIYVIWNMEYDLIWKNIMCAVSLANRLRAVADAFRPLRTHQRY